MATWLMLARLSEISHRAAERITMSPKYQHMVALGSSFAAGPGLKPVADAGAFRSERNYAHLVAQALGATLTDATVSGATTQTILEVPQRLLVHKFEPQIGAVRPGTDLVTITAGGNDIAYLSAVLRTAVLDRLGRIPIAGGLARRQRKRRVLTAPTGEEVLAAVEGLRRIVDEVERRAPGARTVLVDYVPVFDPGTAPGPQVPFTVPEIDHFRKTAATLSAAFAQAAALTGADLVPASAYPSGHATGTADPWVFGRRPFWSAFHPTEQGMRAVADRILSHLDNPGGPAA